MATSADPEVSSTQTAMLQKANKTITDLKEDIRRLSDELKKKDTLLTSYMDAAAGQSSRLATLGATLTALQDTVPWDSSSLPQPSCSTPNGDRLWSTVVCGGRKRDTDAASRLSLSNRYGALSADNPVLPGGVSPAVTAPPRRDPSPKPLTAAADDARAAGSSTELQRLSSRSASSAARRKMVRDAVDRRSRQSQPGKPSPRSPRRPSRPSPAETHGVPCPRAPSSNESPQLPPPRPLFSPTTLIVGDSITRDIRFFNASTRCFPGATVPAIISKLPELLLSLPSSITRIVIHAGSNDTSRRQSELTKLDFEDLFSLLAATGKSIFISGPLPIHSPGRFSRLLALNTWLQSTCRARNIGFIDNFNLFWNRPSFYRADGVHPNRLGSRMLTANIRYTVQQNL